MVLVDQNIRPKRERNLWSLRAFGEYKKEKKEVLTMMDG